MTTTDLKAIADDILQQLHVEGAQAAKKGTFIFLPKYIDAQEAQTLQVELNSRSSTKYEVRHRIGERRLWVKAL